MKRAIMSWLCAVAFAQTSILTSLATTAGIYDDACLWLKGFRDANEDGYVNSKSDMPDARDVSAEIDWMMYGRDASRACRTENVFCQYVGRSLSAPCLYLPQETYIENDKTYIYQGSIGLSSSQRVAVTNGLGTVIARIRPDVDQPVADGKVFLTGGFYPQLMLESKNGVWYLAAYAKSSGGSGTYPRSSLKIPMGEWSDVAVTYDGEKIVWYMSASGRVENASYDFQMYPSEQNAFYFGYNLAGRSGASASTSAAYFGSFRGSIHQIAVFNRSLNEAEVREAFAFPGPDLFRMGVVDGTSMEFGIGGATEDTVDPSNWYASPQSLPFGSSLKISFVVTGNVANVQQRLRLAATSGSDSGDVNVAVDDKTTYTIGSSPGQTCSTVIPAEEMTPGEHTFVLTRATAGTTYIDALSLGGSFQIGIEDGTYDEFALRGDCVFYADDYDWQHMLKQINKQTTNEWKFTLPCDLATDKFLVEVVAVSGKKISEYAEPFRVAMLVNGAVVLEDEFVARPQTFSAKLPCGYLHEGENTLALANLYSNGESGYYVKLDCIRLIGLGGQKGLVINFK